MKKARKPRGIKLNGDRSMDLCKGCLSFGCDPMADSRECAAKKDMRSEQGVCLSCGADPCKCKSSLDVKPDPICSKCGQYIMGRVHQRWTRDGVLQFHKKCLGG